jgi:NhaA family Na+:H+ antiporter
MEHDLHSAVAFVILPLFAFANAGVKFDERAVAQLFTGIPLGIAAGLFFGKQAGVFLFSWLAVKLKIAPMPDITWRQLYGVAILTGVGFTMSLFIGSLAFEQATADYVAVDRMGILIGSGLAALFGYFYLNAVLPKTAPDKKKQQPSQEH